MTTAMPVLETERLIIRPFVIEDAALIGPVVHSVDLSGKPIDYDAKADTYAEDLAYVQKAIATVDYLASMYQPPFGDRAVVLKSEQKLIGCTGLVPITAPFSQLHYFSNGSAPQTVQRNTSEIGLYYAFDPAYWRQGFATETAQALIDYVFHTMNMQRVIAMTDFDNFGSQGVMRKLGMTVERNPLPEPQWFRMVGILENPLENT
jgi:ribosomal-protein-alanine N-acetyltransferase